MFCDELLLSIVIPVYNTKPEYLHRCLDPFVSYDDYRVEIVVSDDGSEKTTVNTVQEILDNISLPTIFLHNILNGGQNTARNYGIQHANGKYIIFLDSDDFIDLTSLSLFLNIIDKHRSVDMFVFNADTYNEKYERISEHGLKVEIEEDVNRKEMVRNCSELWTCAFKKSLLERNPLKTGYSIGEDLISLIPLIIDAKSIYGVPLPLYKYVQHESSMMHMTSFEKRSLILAGFSNMLNNLGNYVDDFHDELEWQAIWHFLFWEPLHALQSGDSICKVKMFPEWVEKHFPKWRDNLYLHSDEKARGISFKLIVGKHYCLYRLLRSFYQLKNAGHSEN